MKWMLAAATMLVACQGEFNPDLIGFQPDEGIYSACTRSAECGEDACLGSPDVLVELDDVWDGQGVCTRWASGNDPEVECGPYPEGYATAEMTYGMSDDGALFCVLECDADLKCPVGMECTTVRSPATLYEAEVCL